MYVYIYVIIQNVWVRQFLESVDHQDVQIDSFTTAGTIWDHDLAMSFKRCDRHPRPWKPRTAGSAEKKYRYRLQISDE